MRGVAVLLFWDIWDYSIIWINIYNILSYLRILVQGRTDEKSQLHTRLSGFKCEMITLTHFILSKITCLFFIYKKSHILLLHSTKGCTTVLYQYQIMNLILIPISFLTTIINDFTVYRFYWLDMNILNAVTNQYITFTHTYPLLLLH